MQTSVVVTLPSTQSESRDPQVRPHRAYTTNGYTLYHKIDILYRYIFNIFL
jgi:hypothetical protein